MTTWSKMNDEQKTAARAYKAAWRASHRAQEKASRDRIRASSADKLRAQDAAWRRANPEKVRNIARRYAKTAAEFILGTARAA